MTSYNILITCIGGGYASQNIKLIKKSKIYKNIKIIGIDINAGNEADFFCDFTYKVPHGSHQNYIKSVLRIVKKHQIKLIIPCSDEEAVQLSSKLLYFNKIGVNVACTNYNNSVLISKLLPRIKREDSRNRLTMCSSEMILELLQVMSIF